jgi:DNA invertase Pin-like site-specific DNA recombinase
LRIVEQLTARGIAVQFIKEGKTFKGSETADPMDKLMLSMLGAFAEYERTLIRERQREGIAKAKLRGVYRGLQQKITDQSTIAQMVSDATALGANKTKVAAKYGVSRETLYKYLADRS